MNTKDWILLLVPIFCNGVIVFILQKVFEKKQITNNIKYEYATELRKKIDFCLELHAEATRLANEGDKNKDREIIETLQKYVNSVLDVYYYYIQNKVIFGSLENKLKLIAKYLMELTEYSQKKEGNSIQLSSYFNKIRDELMYIKNKCIKLDF